MLHTLCFLTIFHGPKPEMASLGICFFGQVVEDEGLKRRVKAMQPMFRCCLCLVIQIEMDPLGCPPAQSLTVTTRMITFLVRDSYKPSFATVCLH